MANSADESLARLSVNGIAFGIWYEDLSQALWIQARGPGDSAWRSGVNVTVWEGGVDDPEAFIRQKVLPAFNAYVLQHTTGAPVLEPLPEGKVGAVLGILRDRLYWDGQKLALRG